LNHICQAGISKALIGYDGPDELREAHLDICIEFSDKIKAEFVELPFNIGLSAVRNKLASMVETEFLLIIDDDMYTHNNLADVIPFLKKHDEIAAIGFPMLYDGFPVLDAFDFKGITKRYLIRADLEHQKDYEYFNNNLFAYYFDNIPNCAVYKTATLEELKWDENIVIGIEHPDFFYNAKLNSQWKFGVCLSQFAIHDQSATPPDFLKYRLGEEDKKGIEYFRKKWNVVDELPPSNKFFHGYYDSRISYDIVNKAKREWIKRLENSELIDAPLTITHQF